MKKLLGHARGSRRNPTLSPVPPMNHDLTCSILIFTLAASLIGVLTKLILTARRNGRDGKE